VVAVTDYAEGELFQILEDDGSLPEEQVPVFYINIPSVFYNVIFKLWYYMYCTSLVLTAVKYQRPHASW
jgi:hypothetical protein